MKTEKLGDYQCKVLKDLGKLRQKNLALVDLVGELWVSIEDGTLDKNFFGLRARVRKALQWGKK